MRAVPRAGGAAAVRGGVRGGGVPQPLGVLRAGAVRRGVRAPGHLPALARRHLPPRLVRHSLVTSVVL